jgi:hypothetical protein
MEVTTRPVYTAKDGSIFLHEEQCREYEKKLDQIRYYKILHSPDLNETGCFRGKTLLAVNGGSYCKQMAYSFGFRCFGDIMGPSVMGYGHQPSWELIPIEAEEWNKDRMNYNGVFLSDEEVTNFPPKTILYLITGFDRTNFKVKTDGTEKL